MAAIPNFELMDFHTFQVICVWHITWGKFHAAKSLLYCLHYLCCHRLWKGWNLTPDVTHMPYWNFINFNCSGNIRWTNGWNYFQPSFHCLIYPVFRGNNEAELRSWNSSWLPLWQNLPWWRQKIIYFPQYCPFARGIHRSPTDSPHKGQWRFLWSVLEQRFERIIKTPVIWDAIALIVTSQ